MTKVSLKDLAPKVLGLCFFFSFFSFSVSAQSSAQSSQESQAVVMSENNQSDSRASSVSNASSQNGSSQQNWNWSSPSYEENRQNTSTFGLFVKMVFALALVLVLAYLVIRFLKRGTKLLNSDDPFLRRVAHLNLSSGRSVDIVTVLDKAYLIGVTDNSINLIGQIEDKELIDSMNLYADKNDKQKRPQSFSDVLDLFMPHGPRDKNNQNVFASSAQEAADMLRQQRDRLNGGV